MVSFRITESITSLIAIIIIQILLFCALVFLNDIRLYNRNGVTNHPKHNSTVTVQPNSQMMAKIAVFLNRLKIISQELWNYLVVYSQTVEESKESTRNMLEDISDIKNIIQLEALSLSENFSIEDWRQKEFKELSELIDRHLNVLQNPAAEQCLTGRPIVCNHTNTYGFAAGLHDIVWCLIAGYYSNRTVVLLTKHYHYLKEGTDKWTDFFMPLSSTCDEIMFENRSEPSLWPGSNNPVTRRLIRYLPKSIGKRIVAFHSNPMAFWLGRFASYIMRPQPRVQSVLNRTKLRLDFTHPIVGLHVRRTDKIGSEAGFHNLSEYMVQIDDFYRRGELVGTEAERKIYLATDDPSVWRECRDNYPNYKFIGNQRASVLASKLKTRYNTNSLMDLLIDIYLLSETDYLVCTMSSNVCRLAFELMQNRFTDGGLRAQSIDVPFHYAFAYNPSRVAIYNHRPRASDQWSVQIGDIYHSRNGEDFIGQAINGKKYDSFLYGTDNDRTDYLKYPSYKTIQKIALY